MMTDDGGISGAAGYLLGRMDAEHDRWREDLVRTVATRLAPSVPSRRTYDASEVHEVIDGWKSLVHTRDVTIAQLRDRDAALASERDQWRDYARAVEGEREELKDQYRRLNVSANLMVERLDEYDRANEALETEVETLRAEVARLKGAAG